MSHDGGRDAISHKQIDRRALLRGAIGGAVLLSGVDLLKTERQSVVAQNASSGPQGKPTGTLRVANPGEPNFIDPADALEITELSIVRNVYGGLMNWDSTYTKLVPDLATSWESSGDAMKWTFQLRKGVRFHDGAPFDSTAARKTIEHYKGKTWGLVWANLEKIDDSQPYVLKLFFSKPAPDLARNQTLARMISPKLIAANATTKEMAGTGPFRWKAWNKGRSVILEANPEYWAKGLPRFQEIQLLTIRDKVAAINALKSGDVDLIMKIDPKQLQTLLKDPRFAASSKQAWLTDYVFYRWDVPPTNDVRVRQAIAYGIDRQKIVNDVLLGKARVSSSPMPYGTYGWVNPPTQYTYDPAKARSLLKEAGYSNGVSLKMATQAGVLILGEEVAQALVGQLSEVGINAKLDIMEPGLFVKELLASRPPHHLFHAEFGWPDGSEFHFTVGNAFSYTGATASQLQKLQQFATKTTTTPDGPHRLQYLAELQDEFMKELPYLPLFDPQLSDVFQAKIKGYSNPRDGFLPYFGGAHST